MINCFPFKQKALMVLSTIKGGRDLLDLLFLIKLFPYYLPPWENKLPVGYIDFAEYFPVD